MGNQDEDKTQQQFSLFFNNDKVVGIKGNLKPNLNTGPKIAKETTLEIPKRDLDKTMWEKLTTLFGLLSNDNPIKNTKQDTKPATTNDNLPL